MRARGFSRALVLAVWAAGAGACEPADPEGEDPFEGTDETGQADDDSALSDDDTTPEDDDTTPPDDDDTTPPEVDEVVSLRAVPSDIAVDPSTGYALLLVGTTESGRTLELAPDAVDTDDAAVAVASADGAVTPVAPGEAWLTAWSGGLSASAKVRVVEPGTLSVDVVDAATGLPVEGAEVLIGASAAPVAWAQTDASGTAVLAGDFQGRVVVTAVAEGYARASIAGAAAREQRLPLRPDSGAGPAWGEASGPFAWPADFAGEADLALGIVASGHRGNPVMYDLAGLLGEERAATVYGFDVELPGNLVVEGEVEDFVVPAEAGEAALWGLAAAIPLADAVEIAAAEPEDQLARVLEALVDLLPGMKWGLAGGLAVEADATVAASMAPLEDLGVEVALDVPPNPLGTAPGDTPLTLALADLGDAGWALCGMAFGSGAPVLRRVDAGALPAGAALGYVAVVEEGGVGSGGDASSTHGDLDPDTGLVAFPAFLDIPSLTPPAAVADWAWAHTAVAGADLFVHVLDARMAPWDVYAAGDSTGFTLADVTPRLGLDQVFWYAQALSATGATFDSLTNRADSGLEAREEAASRQSRTWLHYAATPLE